MNKYHQEIVEQLKKAAGHKYKYLDSAKYEGSPHFHYFISAPKKREIIKTWISKHKGLTLDEFISLLGCLYKGKSYEEKTTAGLLLGYLPKFREKLDPNLLDKWLEHLEGWAEIDATCQSNFTAKEILENWNGWEKLMKNLSKDENISKKRASLVLLTRAVAQSNDERLIDLAFENINRLKTERNILITKAISWLLRSMIKNHKTTVEKYLNKNSVTLPKIAIRETQNKLLFI